MDSSPAPEPLAPMVKERVPVEVSAYLATPVVVKAYTAPAGSRASPTGMSVSSIDTPVAVGMAGSAIESVVKVGVKVVSGTFVKRSLVASWGWAATRDVGSIPLTGMGSLLTRTEKERL